MRCPSNNIKNCNIIFVHGFLGDGIENHRMFIKVADALNEIGYTCFLFDQTGCGYSDGDYSDVRLETLKKDLTEVIKWVKQTFAGEIALLGQSLGSALALAMISKVEVKFAIAINPAAHFDKWLSKRYNWDIDSENNVFCAIPKGIFVSRQLIDDLINWEWIDELSNSTIPVLIVCSTNDGIGSYEVSKESSVKLGIMSTITTIYNADHSFTNQPQLENYAIKIIVDWLNRKGM